MPVSIVEAVVAANDARKHHMAGKVIKAMGGDVKGKTVAVLGLSFKPNTDDMRESPALVILPALVAAGATVRAYDPEAMEESKKLISDIDYTPDMPSAMANADCLVLLTEWNQFRALAPETIKKSLKTPVVVDLRNVFRPEDMAAAGISYTCIGQSDSAQ
jgi:UDPglucose 6-dehydrogenase